jgi:non-heme chloroperoxidase
MTINIKTAELSTGVTIPYVEQGDRAGIPLVLLHGITDSWRSFEGLLPLLPRSIRAFALSQRGHGDADRPEGGYRPRDFAADVAAFMDAVGLESAVIVGHSMGSFVAQRFALDYPERVRGLALMGSGATIHRSQEAIEFRNVVSNLQDPIDPEFVRDFQVSTLTRPVPEGLLDMAVSESLKVPARVWRASLDGMFDDDHSSELRRIAAPTVVLWGDGDSLFTRYSQEALLGGIAGAELVVYPGGGHGFHWEDPVPVAEDLTTFASKC